MTSAGPLRLIARPDLIAALDRAALGKVTIISAPAGSGKTSLLRAWTAQAGRVAAMSVRPGQEDAQLFWLTLLGAVRQAFGTDSDAGSLAPAPGFDGHAMADRVLAEIHGPVTLVIDDLHELRSADALEPLEYLLTSLPPAAHAVLATRRDPRLRLHQLRLAGDLAELRDADLRFTLAETASLVASAGVSLSADAVAMLHQRTEGWAAGLRLALLSLAGHPDPERFVAEFSGSDRTVAEYLIAEMLERLPSDVQRLLLRTSVLDRVNGELADLLTGSSGGASGAERVLLDLEDANAFVTSLDPARTWFRYHRLFSEFLRLELRQTTPAEIPELHRLAAGWLAQHGQAAEAIGHLQAAGDWAAAATLLTDNALSLTLDGQAETVRALLRAFPAGPGADSAELALVYAIADLDQSRLDEAAAHLEIARSYAATTPPDRRHRLSMAVAALDLLLARLHGNFDGVVEQVESLLAEVSGRPVPATVSAADIARASDVRVLALLNLGVAQAWVMRLRDSARYLLEGATLAREIGRPYLEVACRAQLGFASTTSFATAQRRCDEAIALAARHCWDDQPVIAPALVTLAGMKIWTGEFADGERWLDRAVLATRSGSEPGLRLLLHLIAGMHHAARGRLTEALEEFGAAGRVQEFMASEHALATRVAGCTIATQARLGRPGEARATLAALPSRQAATGEIRNAAAVICLAEGDPGAARRELAGVLDGTAPASHPLTLVEGELLAAVASRELGEQRALRQAVERALDIAEPERLILPFVMTGAWELLARSPGTAHAALITDILDVARGAAPGTGGPAVAAAGPPAAQLSPTELRVLRYLPTNLTRPEIASELSVSLNTVSTHVRSIYAKLGATDRSAAVQRARELRLLAGDLRQRR